MKFKFIIYMLLGCVSLSAHSTTLHLAGRSDDNKLHLTLLKEVVKRSDRFDAIEYIYDKTGQPADSRVLADLEEGKLDIMWRATSIDMEKRFRAIHFPIYRGLLGYRIGLIHEKDKNMLSRVNSKHSLAKFRICTGKMWPDTFILDANGLSTAKSLKYPNIFHMLLAGNRCELFARGVMEPFSEMESYPELPLAVDDNIMLRYRMPYMLFVSKNNQELASHLTDIIGSIFDDGTYEEMFFNDDEVRTALSQAGLQHRAIIDLENPFLTADTKAIPEHYFYNPLAQ